MYAIVLCGGSGDRLWPFSLPHCPKQFTNLLDESKTMLDLTLERLPAHCTPILVGAEGLREHLQPYEAKYPVIYELAKKNTAISVLLGLLYIKEHNMDSQETHKIAVIPCDHYFAAESFRTFLTRELEEVETLTLIGITPTRAETGYGYIAPAATVGVNGRGKILSFIEKPSKPQAEELVSRGWLWNSGIYLGELRHMIDLYYQYAPQLYLQILGYHLEPSREKFQQFPDISIDKAIMEPYSQGMVAQYYGEWNDLGAWNRVDSLPQSQPPVLVDCDNCQFHIDHGKVIALGLQNIIVAKKDNNILLAAPEKLDDLKQALTQLSTINYRPWGYYEDLAIKPDMRYKRIVVYPHQRLSLQYHFYRAEYWVIVRGQGLVQIDEVQSVATPGSFFFIPIRAHHRLSNTSDEILEMYEIQLGSYVGEDDIVRISDDYQR